MLTIMDTAADKGGRSQLATDSKGHTNKRKINMQTVQQRCKLVKTNAQVHGTGWTLDRFVKY